MPVSSNKYFTTMIEPKIRHYLKNRDAFLVKSENELTIHVEFELGKYSTALTPYYDLIRQLSSMFPIVSCRDASVGLKESFIVIGKDVFITLFMDILIPIIQAVERGLKSKSDRVEISNLRFRAIEGIGEKITHLKQYRTPNIYHNRLLTTAKEYKEAYSFLNIKKSFNGK